MIHCGKCIRPKSWSAYARSYADRMIEGCEYEIEEGRETVEGAKKFMKRTISNSVYGSKSIMMARVAKRLRRKGWY